MTKKRFHFWKFTVSEVAGHFLLLLFQRIILSSWASLYQKKSLSWPGGSVVKNLPANAGNSKDSSSISVSGRSPGEGNGNPLHYCCLKNPMDRGAWQAAVHRIAEWDTTEHACKVQSKSKTGCCYFSHVENVNCLPGQFRGEPILRMPCGATHSDLDSLLSLVSIFDVLKHV